MSRYKLLLHIGPHKTGSTSIQDKLASLSPELQKLGWTYIQRFKSGLSVHGLAGMLSQGRFNKCRLALEELVSFSSNLILSSENFSRLGPHPIKNLASCTTNFDVTVVYYIRNPLSRLYSAWQEWVKHGYTYTLPEYLANKMAHCCSDPEINDLIRVKNWEVNFSRARLVIRNYDAIYDVVEEFLEAHLNYGLSSGKAPKQRSNVSFGIPKIEAIRASFGAYRTLVLNAHANDSHGKAFTSIVEQISSLFDQGFYAGRINASADDGPFGMLEEEIAAKFPHLPRSNGFIFQPRTIQWTYIDPIIWIVQMDLTRQMCTLRNSLLSVYGPPKIDVRLKQM